ncbi:MAG: hypothetical protein ACF8Q5_10445 [Phycisphaerales bacterium JB040]
MPRLLAASLTLLTTTALAQQGPDRDEVDTLFRAAITGEVGDASLEQTELTLTAFLDESPDNDDARLALAVTRFLRAGETAIQTIHTHGGFNLPLQASMVTGMGDQGLSPLLNFDPQPIDYPLFRAHIQTFLDTIAEAEATLAQIDDPHVKLRLPIGLVHFDMNNSGTRAPDEQLWRVFTNIQRRFDPSQADADAYAIALDRGDVAWLRGYCHLLMAAGDFFLAHDSRELFERAGHLFFAKNESPHTQLKGLRKVYPAPGGPDAVDLVALVHLLSLDVTDPERTESARRHLLKTIELGHEMWSHYDAETDDDMEWIPNPTQTSTALPNVSFNEEQRAVWLRALTEATDLLEGRRVARFWRGNNERGINVKRVFTDPRPFDLILWIQGSAATPYLEVGDCTSDQLWHDLQTAFDQGAFQYMFWLN